MKKSFLTITLMTVVLSTFAQLPFTFDLGIKGGINTSKITTDNPSISGYNFSDFKNDVKSGYNIGLFARLGSKKIYLQPEVLYCKKNGEVAFTYLSQTYYQKISLNTIQIPVLLGFKLINLKLVSVRAFTGPAMSISLSDSNVKAAISTLSTPNTFKNNIWDWQLGGGVDVGPLTLDLRYEWGLSKLSDGNFSPTNIGFSNKGNFMTFSLGFKFI